MDSDGHSNRLQIVPCQACPVRVLLLHLPLHCSAVQVAGIQVRVGSNPISIATPPDKNGNVLCGSYTSLAGSVGPLTIKCTTSLNGRYVSIQRAGVVGLGSNLGLCEVQVRI